MPKANKNKFIPEQTPAQEPSPNCRVLGSDIELAIQEKVAEKVEHELGKIERLYTKFGIAIVAIVGIAATLIGIDNKNSMREKVAETIRESDTGNQLRGISEASNEAQRTRDSMRISYAEYSRRLDELKTLDNLVTIQAFRTNLVAFEQATHTLKKEYEFIRIKAEVRNSSYTAYKELRKIADDRANPYSIEANKVWEILQLRFEDQRSDFANNEIIKGRLFTWPAGVNPDSYPWEDFYNGIATAERLGTLYSTTQIVWASKSYTTAQKMQFSVRVMQQSDDMYTLAMAGLRFAKEAKLENLPLLSVNEYLTWWEENKGRYPMH